MPKKLLMVGLVVAAFFAGWTIRPFFEWAGGQLRGGSVKCAGGICVGMSDQTLRLSAGDDELGGVIDITCGFDAPRSGAVDHRSPMDLMSENCGNDRYVVSYSNGERLTNYWVDKRHVVRVDDYPLHTIDP